MQSSASACIEAYVSQPSLPSGKSLPAGVRDDTSAKRRSTAPDAPGFLFVGFRLSLISLYIPNGSCCTCGQQFICE
jgi:hypothetical protein